MPSRKNIVLLFFTIFLFRLFFGLCQSSWSDYDEKQSYLTGLKFYTTGDWPYFGPDAAGSESSYYSQIPGALEGLVIGLPFYIVPIPEAPYVAVNLLSTATLLFLAWYIRKRIPSLSFVWLTLWIAIAPWSIFYPTHISNMSYLYFSGILFIVGFLESLPLFSVKALSTSRANFLMGFSLFWIMQFHLSYVFLLPMAVFSLAVQLKNKRPIGFLYFILGALIPFAFVVPTYLQYGLNRANSHSGVFIALNWDNIKALFVLLARYLSLACFELPSFIGAHTVERFAFLKDHILLLPGAFLWLAGILQALVLLFSWFRKSNLVPGWREFKWLSLLVFGMVYGSFWFTIKPPLSHIYLVLFPLIMIYSCYGWAFFANDLRWRLFAKAFVLVGLFFQLSYAVAVAPRDSLYTQRDLVAKAIQEKNYHLLGERSPGSLY